MFPKTQRRGCQVVPMFSSILKVLVTVGTTESKNREYFFVSSPPPPLEIIRLAYNVYGDLGMIRHRNNGFFTIVALEIQRS